MTDFDPFGDEQLSSQIDHERSSSSEESFDPFGDLPEASTRTERSRSSTEAVNADRVQGPGSILVICTGNVCRSPYIHLRLEHELTGLGIDVSSAGTGALVGRPVDSGSARLLERAGIASEGFRARQLTPDMVEAADIVLTATQSHRREVVQKAPAGLRKTFTLADFADLVAAIDGPAFAQSRGPNELGHIAAAASSQRYLVPARRDEDVDIVDPFRRSTAVFEQMEAMALPLLDVVVNGMRTWIEPK